MDLNLVNQRAKRVNRTLIENLLKEEILKNKDEIVALVKDRWTRGKRPDGTLIGKDDLEYKSFAYQQEKLRQNPLAGGNVDLILTGALSGDLTIFPLAGGNFSIFSSDEKAVNIAQKYGIDVYGLTKEEEIMVLGIAFTRINVSLINFVQTGAML